MFTMGLTMTPADFAEVLRKPGRIILVQLAQYLLMPLMGFILVTTFRLPNELALGLILLGFCFWRNVF